MQELLRTNDPVRISFLRALLADAGIETLVFDQHASVMDGMMAFLERRIMVADDDLDRAQRLLDEAGEEYRR